LIESEGFENIAITSTTWANIDPFSPELSGNCSSMDAESGTDDLERLAFPVEGSGLLDPVVSHSADTPSPGDSQPIQVADHGRAMHPVGTGQRVDR
jgi:hypothetical protein